nr:EamA family transporter [Sphingomonas sp. Y57]
MNDAGHHRVPLSHLLLALGVVLVWGTNFTVIRVALDELPPLLFAALRFFFALVPAAFFIRRPAVSWRSLAAYGILIGVGQFGLLYIAMDGFISPGLASLVVQSHVFFTIVLAMLFSGEALRPFQIVALSLSVLGIALIIEHGDASATLFGLALTLVAALCWGIGNHVAKASGATDMLGFVVWASLFAVPPLFLFALVAEGWPAIAGAIAHAGPTAWAAVLWQSVGNTMFGYAAWGWLLARHPAAAITPTAMLVPVVGMATSAIVLGEALPAWKIAAAALVIGGLALNMLWPRAARLVLTSRASTPPSPPS